MGERGGKKSIWRRLCIYKKLFTTCRGGETKEGGKKLINSENPSMLGKSGRTARTETRRI